MAYREDSKEREEQSPMLLRFILYSLIAYLVIGFIKKLLRGAGDKTRATGARKTPTRRAASAALMVRCSACGTFIAESRAIMVGASGFCSNACANRAA